MFPYHEEPPLGGVSNGDFAQDEASWLMDCRRWQTSLILSEVEGYCPKTG